MTPYRILPFVLFVALLGFLAYGLTLNPREVPSPLVKRPAPEFRLPRLDAPERKFATADMRGQVWLLNVWASWCTSCRQEHPHWLRLQRESEVAVVGLNYKDTRREALGWLQRQGDPYRVTVMDPDGRIGLEYGVYGTPETFLIDRDGIIRYKYTGPIDRTVLENVLLPKIAALSSGNG